MDYCNILISESQERMLIIAQKENVDKIMEIFEKWGLEYAIIGKTNNTSKYNVYYDDNFLYSEAIENLESQEDYTCIIKKNNTMKDETKPIKVKNMEKWKVYDSTIGNRTLKGPDKPGSYSVLNIPEVKKQLILVWGESIDKCYYNMRMFENVKPLCIVNCLNYGDPKHSLYDFKETIDNLIEKCEKYKIPVVGGNVSLYNTTNDVSIRPTPIILMLGITK